MTRRGRELAMKISRKMLSKEDIKRLDTMVFKDIGFGYDKFGFEKETAVLAYAIFLNFYLYWFRVESHGAENIPKDTRAILVPNHSGTIPIDGMMIAIDVLRKTTPPRILRSVVEYFAATFPFINTFFYRCGQVIGARKNFAELLEDEELICVFPEGAKGPGKPWSQRYKLIKFNVGFLELALQHRAPIIPVAVIGSEEQAPMITNIKPIADAFGFPYFPITWQFPWLGPLGLLPFPVKYIIHYGKPLELYKDYPPETASDPDKVRELVELVRSEVQNLIAKGLKMRKSIF
jgi:1-acyl-sn-glycerol-3-phosphate acyltransferase